MTRYMLRVVDAPGQPARCLPPDSDALTAIIEEATRMADAGHIGGVVAVVDTAEHPDRNLVHVARCDR